MDYLISTAAELKALAAAVNESESDEENPSPNPSKGKYYKLTADIDLGGFNEYGDGIEDNQWTPIKPFRGVFDGGDHTISGLYYYTTGDASDFGLFGKVVGGTIKNLTVEGSLQAHDCVGGICGKLSRGRKSREV